MAVIKNRIELKDYILTDLGEPVIKVNVDDKHLEQAINDALELFFEFAEQGSILHYFKYPITLTDVSNGYIQLDDIIDEVIRVIPSDSNNLTNAQFGTYLYELRRGFTADQFLAGGYQLMDVALFNTYYATFQSVLGYDSDRLYQWDRIHRRIYPTWTMTAGEIMCFECDKKIDDLDVGESPIYNDKWVKSIAVAFTQKKWGNILKKFGNVALPGGVILDGEKLYDDAKQDIETLKQELEDRYMPPDQFWLM